MKRRIVGYGSDAAGEPVAILECGHPQHIRHKPPFINRPWTQTAEGRAQMLGHELNCVRCEAEGWFVLGLGDALIAERATDEIIQTFKDVYERAGRPADMALLRQFATASSLHCEVRIYFSPGASGVARLFSAAPSVRPLRADLELLAGSQECFEEIS